MAERLHSRPQQFWTGSAVNDAFEGLQAIDLTFCLAVTLWHFDGVFDRIEVPVYCEGKAHEWRQVGFNRVRDPCREQVCLAAAQDTVEPHGGTAHSCEDERAGLDRVDFPRVNRGQLCAACDPQSGRDDLGDRVPGFGLSDWLKAFRQGL